MVDIDIPKGINVEITQDRISVSGSLGKNERAFNNAILNVKKEGERISIGTNASKRLQKKATSAAIALAKEIRNDIDGVSRHFEISMESTFAHFPITLEAKGDSLIIKNMLGERAARTAHIVGSTKIEIKDKKVRVYGIKLDDVTQTAANIRIAVKVRNKDNRIFQDGVYYSLE
ncbi:MAG: 50S ribosomal protein L6 [Candidatus Marsarchaeota archaeon]|jgi:large subunit ribosomal protein L6|nr:50S ribosomal protein L6 [Candidatus Marsarchaeota archaeon]